MRPAGERLSLLVFCHALLVLAVPIGLAFVLLWAFELRLADTLPTLVRIVSVVLVWLAISIATNHVLETPDRTNAREAREKAAILRAEASKKPYLGEPGLTQKPVRPGGR